MSLRGLATAAHYDPSLLSKVLNGHRPHTPHLAACLDRALGAAGQVEAAAAHDQAAAPPRQTSRGRRKPPRAIQALQTVADGDPDGMDIAADSIGELIGHYSRVLAVTPSPAVYDELLALRSYAGTLPGRVPSAQRAGLDIALGWLSSLLAVSATDMGDHAAAIVWCADTERRGQDASYPELLGWAALTRAMIAYYQGQAGSSADLARYGQEAAPAGTAVRARLAAQEMRSRAMLGDAAGMTAARYRASAAIEQLAPGIPAAGVFSVPRDQDPPYAGTSLLLIGRYTEAATITRRLIDTVYQPQVRPPGEQPTNYARTLLILGLATAALGDADEAASIGSAALDCGRIVWPTMVLARRLDRWLADDIRGTAQVVDYHARVSEAREHLAVLPSAGGSQ